MATECCTTRWHVHSAAGDRDLPTGDRDLPALKSRVTREDRDLPAWKRAPTLWNRDLPAWNREPMKRDRDLPAWKRAPTLWNRDLPAWNREPVKRDRDLPARKSTSKLGAGTGRAEDRNSSDWKRDSLRSGCAARASRRWLSPVASFRRRV